MASPSTSAESAYDSEIAKNISSERTDYENESQNSNEDKHLFSAGPLILTARRNPLLDDFF
jgi:hypothetical protein